jgi:hypothetical protein
MPGASRRRRSMSARRWLRQRVVIVADRSRDLPCIIAFVPKEGVVRFANRLDGIGPSRARAMDTGRGSRGRWIRSRSRGRVEWETDSFHLQQVRNQLCAILPRRITKTSQKTAVRTPPASLPTRTEPSTSSVRQAGQNQRVVAVSESLHVLRHCSLVFAHV